MQGWVKFHRQITDSDIYKMPPLYMRVFERLIIEANHKDVEIPYREKGSRVYGKKLIKRGERLTSIRNIGEWVAWYERGCLKIPNPKTISSVLDYLIQENMIFIYNKGNSKETHYKVVNYDIYQDSIEEESNTKVTTSKQLLDTNKNDNNVKNENKNIYSDIFNLYLEQEIIKHKELTGTMKKAIDKANKKFSIDEIKLAITRYGTMYRDKENNYAIKYCKYKWTLQELLTREKGVSEFLDEGGKWIRYTDKQQANKSSVKSSQNNNTGWNGYKKFE